MREIEIKGEFFSVDHLDAMNQLYVARRIGPLLLNVARNALADSPQDALAAAGSAPSLAPGAENAQDDDRDASTAIPGAAVDFMKLLNVITAVYGPFIEQMAQMKDEDLRFVIVTCLSVCRKRDGQSWAPLVASDGRQLMYGNMKLVTMMRLTTQVIRENLSDFFELLSGAA